MMKRLFLFSMISLSLVMPPVFASEDNPDQNTPSQEASADTPKMVDVKLKTKEGKIIHAKMNKKDIKKMKQRKKVKLFMLPSSLPKS